MLCPKCGTENPEQAKFCKGCGHPLQVVHTGAPSWVWWGVGIVVVLLVIGGGLFFSGLFRSPFLESIPAGETTISASSVVGETPTPAPDAAQGTTLTLVSTQPPPSKPTASPMPTATATPTPMPPTATPQPSPTLDPLLQCADAPQQGLQVGDQVYVCTLSERLILRAAPNRSSAEVLKMNPGTALAIVDGATCAGDWLWWKVQTEGDIQGWVVEGGDATDPFYICKTRPCEMVTGPFAEVWAGSVQQDIGCKTGEAFQGLVAEEHFEGGIMFWREAFDQERSPVLFNDGTWRFYQHTRFVEGSPEFSCVDANTPAQCPPTPKRGFGMMWCNIPELRERLGNAVDCERGYYATMQTFDNGFILRNDLGAIYILYDDGTWQRR